MGTRARVRLRVRDHHQMCVTHMWCGETAACCTQWDSVQETGCDSTYQHDLGTAACLPACATAGRSVFLFVFPEPGSQTNGFRKSHDRLKSSNGRNMDRKFLRIPISQYWTETGKMGFPKKRETASIRSETSKCQQVKGEGESCLQEGTEQSHLGP